MAAKKEVENAAKKLKTSGGNAGRIHSLPQPKRRLKLQVLTNQKIQPPSSFLFNTDYSVCTII